MPAINVTPTFEQPMTFRGEDGRVYKTEIMEIKARDAVAHNDGKVRKSWLGTFLRSPD